MKSTIDIFKDAEAELKSKSWFKKGCWLTSVHGFPRANPEFITFHVFKKHWFNEDNQGIHIESYLAIDPKKRKKSYVTIHILHHATIPGTKLKRTLISKAFVDEIYDEVRGWDDFEFRAGKYGVQPFTKVLDGSAEDFEKTLVKDITKICQKLGPVMDKVIKDILKR